MGDFDVDGSEVEAWRASGGKWAQVVRLGLTCRSNDGWSPIECVVGRPDTVAAIGQTTGHPQAYHFYGAP